MFSRPLNANKSKWFYALRWRTFFNHRGHRFEKRHINKCEISACWCWTLESLRWIQSSATWSQSELRDKPRSARRELINATGEEQSDKNLALAKDQHLQSHANYMEMGTQHTCGDSCSHGTSTQSQRQPRPSPRVWSLKHTLHPHSTYINLIKVSWVINLITGGVYPCDLVLYQLLTPESIHQLWRRKLWSKNSKVRMRPKWKI